MLIGIGASIYSGNRYDAAISSANLAARFDAALGITSSGGVASAWADQSGNGRNLLQATGANQPIHLPFAGTKYGWLPGVAGNYFSTPDAAANSITGDIDIRWYGALDDWTPASGGYLLSKRNNAVGASEAYGLAVDTNGTLIFTHNNGGTQTQVISTTAPTVANGAAIFVRATWDQSTGFVNFYQSNDGAAWSQVGAADVAGPTTALNDGTRAVAIGGNPDGSQTVAGKCYRAQIYNGIDGTLAVDFDPSRWTSGTTFTAATGETWTINSTGSKPAQIVDRPSLLFDGAAHYMKTAPFTLNQPETVYLVAKQLAWGNRYLIDGNTSDSRVIYQGVGSPNLQIYAGTLAATNSDFTLGVKKVASFVFNGAASSITVGNGTTTTGDVGAGNSGGLTLAANAGPGSYSNIQAYEVLIYNVAHDAATRSNIIRALMSKHGVA